MKKAYHSMSTDVLGRVGLLTAERLQINWLGDWHRPLDSSSGCGRWRVSQAEGLRPWSGSAWAMGIHRRFGLQGLVGG